MTFILISHAKDFSCLIFFLSQKFYGYVEENESWLSSKEAFLANKDLGVSEVG